MNPDQESLANFSGITRLFPLPNLVFFPHALQGLHIFESRYRKMTADALADDGLISLVLLQPGWEDHYEKHPAIQPIACLGRIIADQQLPDGRYNLLLRGLSRIRIAEELHTSAPYRSARVELISDASQAPVEQMMDLRRRLSDALLARFSSGTAQQQMNELFQSDLGLGPLCDILAFALPLTSERKQSLLEQPQEEIRALILLEELGATASTSPLAASSSRRFPPEFSTN